MIEREVLVTTKYGPMPCFAACPDGPGPYPGVIFYLDAGGVREELRNMVRRVARAGYYCIMPDLYYRIGHIRFDIARRSEAMSAVIRPCVASVSNFPNNVYDDTAGLIAFLDAQDNVKPGPIGSLGYCLGGKCVVIAQAKFPRMRAGASLYGIGFVTDKPESPHLHLGSIQGELYFACPEKDNMTPHLPALKQALGDAGIKYELDFFPGTEHGFCFPEKEMYAQAEAETTWEKMFAMWKRVLG